MARRSSLLSLLALGTALVVLPAPEAAAMCAGNVFATCKPRAPAVEPAAATKPAAPARRRKKAPPALRR